jgi:FMN phosphatase YigB (HAD superfamily)
VEALGLESRVDAVLYAEEHAPGGKPSRAAFDAALAAVAVPASRAVFIGDDLVRDIQGARAAGLFTVRVSAAGPRRTDGDADLIALLEEVPAAAGRLVKGSGAHAA